MTVTFGSRKAENEDTEVHKPFGGCERLLNQYRCIGEELLKFERKIRPSSEAFDGFRVGIAFIPIQVLENYLEDLLDVEVDESSLFIRERGKNTNPGRFIVAGLVFGAALFLLGVTILEMPPALATSLGFLAFLPSIAIYFSHPQLMAMRRLRFAQLLSREISRRRGTDTDHTGRTTRLIGELFSPVRPGTLGHSAYHALH